MNRFVISIGVALIGSILMSGCAKNDLYKEVSKKSYNYDFFNSHSKDTGKNEIFINETLNGKKIRLVQKIVIYDKQIPHTLKFNSCTSIKEVPVIEFTKHGYVEHSKVKGKNISLPSCISTVTFTREKTGVYMNGTINIVKGLQYMKNNAMPYVPMSFSYKIKNKKIIYAK